VLVFVDTNIWYPISIADLTLRSVEIGMFELAWTDELMAEIERVAVDKKGLDPLKAKVFIEQIRTTAPAGRVEPSSYGNLVNQMVGRDPDDHIFSAAVQGGKIDVLLTENIVDFPQADLGPIAMALRPDEFFSGLLKTFPLEFVTIIKEMSANLRRPTMSEIEVLERLENWGMHEFAKQMRDLLS